MKYPVILSNLIFSVLISQTLDQIKQAKKYINDKGISKEQAIKLAKDQGYSKDQINDVIKKENLIDLQKDENRPGSDDLNLQSSSTNKSEEIGININEIEKSNKLNDNEELDLIDDFSLLNDIGLDGSNQNQNYFGYDIFKRDPALFQASQVGAVDPDYLIGPSDEIIMMLWGETQFRQVVTVDKEGFIFIPEIGQVFVNGLSLGMLESKLFRVLSQSYSSLNPSVGKSTTFLDVSLGKLRPLRIQVLGQVLQPGAYTVSPSATLFSALYYFNGPALSGSLRDIRLIRDGKQISSIDFYEYLLTGKKPNDIKLQLDDVIFIPNRLKTISIDGEINRSGVYELKDDETLKDLINITGGLKITAYLERSQIDRVVPFDERKTLGMDRIFTDVNLKEVLDKKLDFKLLDGDRIQVFSVLESRQNIVELRGAVTRPGSYDLGDSLKLNDLIMKADGLMGDAYLDRIDVVRTKPDYSQELIKLNLKKVINEDLIENISLQNNDKVRVYSLSEMILEKFVSIRGHVKRPGRFLLQENMTLYDLIFKSGGFLDEEFKKKTYLKRAELVRVIGEKGDKKIIPFNLGLVLKKKDISSMVLQVDDAVRIYSLEEVQGAKRYVEINGKVKKPGKYELYQKNMTISDLLFKAGGFEDPVYRGSTFLGRADLIRYNEDRISKRIIPLNLGSILKDSSNVQNLTLRPGDEVRIYSEKDFSNDKYVKIFGVVKTSGKYALKTNMTIKDLIIEAGGITDVVYNYKVEVARIDPDKVDEEIFAESIQLNINNEFNVSDLEYTYDDESDNIQVVRDEFILKPYDNVYIRPDPYFKMQHQVIVNGAVYFPGVYTILNSEETISDIIKRAGGVRPNSFPFGSTFSRNGQNVQIDISQILKNPNKKDDIVVQNGDEINILEEPNMIFIEGAVTSPGIYKFKKNKRVYGVIKDAGGLLSNTDKKQISITYANGVSKKCNRIFRNYKVKDGSIIQVGFAEPKEAFDPTEYAKELTNILANLAQVISILIIAGNTN